MNIGRGTVVQVTGDEHDVRSQPRQHSDDAPHESVASDVA